MRSSDFLVWLLVADFKLLALGGRLTDPVKQLDLHFRFTCVVEA